MTTIKFNFNVLFEMNGFFLHNPTNVFEKLHGARLCNLCVKPLQTKKKHLGISKYGTWCRFQCLLIITNNIIGYSFADPHFRALLPTFHVNKSIGYKPTGLIIHDICNKV